VTPPVAIAVVSWNTRELLRACLESIAPEFDAGRAEVWVVDNASEDGSPELVREHFPWAELIASEHNLGFGPAVNLVAEQSSTPWLAIANADVELTPGALETLLAVGAADRSAGILAPRLVVPDGGTQHSVYAFPTLPFTLAFNLGLGGLSSSLADRMALEGHWDPDRARRVDWAIGAFLLVRRAAWDAAGGFDPGQWMYAEDLDLGWRAARAGWRTRFEPSAVVRHRVAASTAQVWGGERQVQWQRSTYAWMLRRRGHLIMRSVALVNMLGAAARAGLLAPAGLFLGGEWRAKYRANWQWTRLHLGNLLTPAAELERHR
jgi:GT2 family glycosyltransferase